MLSLSFFIYFAAAANFIAQIPLVDCFPFYNNEERATGSIVSFIASEGPIALQGVLNNIGSGGALAPGVEAGSSWSWFLTHHSPSHHILRSGDLSSLLRHVFRL